MTPLGAIISWPFRLLSSIPLDKWAHAGIGCALGLSALWIGPWAWAPVCIFGIGKKFIDGSPSPVSEKIWDAIATIIGGAVSIGLIWLKAHHV